MAFQARGVSGEVRLGYQTVARLGAWTLDGTGRIDSTSTERNDFRLEQGGPFSVRLTVGAKVWAWREADLLDATGTRMVLRANGSPEVK
jgi:hypothetical protein